MEPEPILFFDSGAGGLPYLETTRERLPRERFIYVADRRNYPYGEKPAAELQKLVVETMAKALRRFAPKLVVVACNTASVVALDALRESFDLPFVGVVPAVKPAAEHLAGGKLAVVATRQTVSGEYLRQLIQNFASGLQVLRIPVANLVDYAEYNPPPRDHERDEAVVRRELAEYLEHGLDSVVLGCTHFTLLDKAFAKVLGPGVRLIDSREGVSRRVLSVLERSGLLAADSRGGSRLFLHGGEADRQRYRVFSRAFGLAFCGQLDEEKQGP
jgi:glutamate racemase